jgi:glycosyltransferase involved in cell wall biosynthesis
LDKIKVNIIIPCFNPPSGDWARNIVKEFTTLNQLLPEQRLGLILVNDGSSKGITASDFETIKSQITDSQIISYEPNRGKGYALRQGVAQSEADFHVFTDVDFPYELRSMAHLITQLTTQKGIAAGYRNQNYYQKVPLFRKILSITFRSFIRLVGVPVNDTQCGLKGFDNQGKALFLKTTIDRYLFDFEFLILAAKHQQISIYSVDVVLKEGIIFSTMGWRVLKTEFFNLLKILLFSH